MTIMFILSTLWALRERRIRKRLEKELTDRSRTMYEIVKGVNK